MWILFKYVINTISKSQYTNKQDSILILCSVYTKSGLKILLKKLGVYLDSYVDWKSHVQNIPA